MGCHPTTTVVDLGASLVVGRPCCCVGLPLIGSVELAQSHEDRGVEFVKGDAFTFEPPPKIREEPRWMVSDIVLSDKIQNYCGVVDTGPVTFVTSSFRRNAMGRFGQVYSHRGKPRIRVPSQALFQQQTRSHVDGGGAKSSRGYFYS
jgi:23S rRNA U2552 (ribose-2'-O)-methylase RlmE/FtsJ